MSYEPTNWKTGDVVTSAKLNKLENAVAQSGGDIDWFVISITSDNDPNVPITIDKTWQEIKDAYSSGKTIVLNLGGQIITQYDSEMRSGELYYINFIVPNFIIQDNSLTIDLWSVYINDTGVNESTKTITGIYGNSQ